MKHYIIMVLLTILIIVTVFQIPRFAYITEDTVVDTKSGDVFVIESWEY